MNDTVQWQIPERFRTPEAIAAAVKEQRAIVENLNLATVSNPSAHDAAAAEHHRRMLADYAAQIDRGEESEVTLAHHIRRERKALGERLAALGLFQDAADIAPDEKQRAEYLRQL